MKVLFASVVGTTVIIAIGLVAVGLARRGSAALRHWVLVTSMACALAVPVFQAVLPSWTPPWIGSLTSVIDSPVSRSSDTTASSAEVPARGDVSMVVSIPAPASVGFGAVLIGIWFAGTAAALLMVLSGLVRLRRLALQSEPVTDGALRQLVADAARGHQAARQVTVFYSAHPAGVVTWGVRRPRILLPPRARQWDHERLRIVLFHELAHVQRHDWLWQMVAAVAGCVYWFNPLFWIAYRRLRHESERACDDVVLQAGVNNADYATQLVAVAQEAGHLRHAWSATAIAHSSTLEERIHAMFTAETNRLPLSRRVRATTTAVVLALSLLVTALASSNAAGANGALQSGAAALAGVLYDQHSGLLPDVTVTLTQNGTGASQTARSDAEGSFAFRNLAAGDYTLLTKLPGFAPVTNVVTLDAGEQLHRNIVMPLGTVQERITVTGDGSPSSGARVRTRAARTLPEPRVATPCVGKIGGCIKVPRKLLDVKPVYPAGFTGDHRVVLVGRIGIDGYMSDLRVDETGTATPLPSEFVESAMEAVRRWEFEPTYLNGAPVEANVTVTVQFTSR